jgi:hypothetical protein
VTGAHEEQAMYQPYPGGGQLPEQPRPAPPSPVVNAVRLMYAGAVLAVIGLILDLTTIGNIRTTLRNANSKSSNKLSPHEINTLVTTFIVLEILIALIGVGLWLWMAWAVKRGRSWARIVSSVLFGLNTLFVLLSLSRLHASLGLLPSLLVWLIGLGAIIFLWRKDSSEYFGTAKAR